MTLSHKTLTNYKKITLKYPAKISQKLAENLQKTCIKSAKT
jgi:hypothetical protein